MPRLLAIEEGERKHLRFAVQVVPDPEERRLLETDRHVHAQVPEYVLEDHETEKYEAETREAFDRGTVVNKAARRFDDGRLRSLPRTGERDSAFGRNLFRDGGRRSLAEQNMQKRRNEPERDSAQRGEESGDEEKQRHAPPERRQIPQQSHVRIVGAGPRHGVISPLCALGLR